MEWDTKEHATKFVESEDLRKIMQKAGVITKPEVHFFEKIEDFRYELQKLDVLAEENSL